MVKNPLWRTSIVNIKFLFSLADLNSKEVSLADLNSKEFSLADLNTKESSLADFNSKEFFGGPQ
jgi:hypothetical protein